MKDSKEIFFKEVLLSLSKLSKCVSKQVGALIVKDGRIISTGYNGTISGYKNCCEVFPKDNFDKQKHHEWSLKYEIHAEQNAIIQAAKNGISINNCVCYTNLQPCNLCLLLLIQSGIKEIVYLDSYNYSDYDTELMDLIKKQKVILRKFEDE